MVCNLYEQIKGYNTLKSIKKLNYYLNDNLFILIILGFQLGF